MAWRCMALDSPIFPRLCRTIIFCRPRSLLGLQREQVWLYAMHDASTEPREIAAVGEPDMSETIERTDREASNQLFGMQILVVQGRSL